MTTNRIVLIPLLVLLAGAASAHSPNTNGDCNNSTGDEALLSVADLHVTATPGVWQETNGFRGLQTHEHVCTMKHDAEGNSLPKSEWTVVTVPADTQVL